MNETAKTGIISLAKVFSFNQKIMLNEIFL